jgi:hypothetical protein
MILDDRFVVIATRMAEPSTTNRPAHTITMRRRSSAMPGAAAILGASGGLAISALIGRVAVLIDQIARVQWLGTCSASSIFDRRTSSVKGLRI